MGTSSVRRKAQILALRPDLVVRDLRGNVDTRLAALGNREYDGIVLAAAGLIRLDLRNRIDEFLDPGEVLPAPGQGALALEVREGDDLAEELCYALHHPPPTTGSGRSGLSLGALGPGAWPPWGPSPTWRRTGRCGLRGSSSPRTGRASSGRRLRGMFPRPRNWGWTWPGTSWSRAGGRSSPKSDRFTGVLLPRGV